MSRHRVVYHRSPSAKGLPDGRSRPELFRRFWREILGTPGALGAFEDSDRRQPYLVFGGSPMEGEDPSSIGGPRLPDELVSVDGLGNLQRVLRKHPKALDRVPRKYVSLPRRPGFLRPVDMAKKRPRVVRPPLLCAFCGRPLGVELGAVYREEGRFAIGWHLQVHSKSRTRKMCWELDGDRNLEWPDLVDVMKARGGERVGTPYWNR